MDNPFTYEEGNLLCIYGAETKRETETSLREVRELLDDEDQELFDLIASVLQKLSSLTEEDYAELEFYLDFDE